MSRETVEVRVLHPCEEFLNHGISLHAFLTEIELACSSSGVSLSEREIDHVCYRVETKVDYQRIYSRLSSMGSVLAETMIGGRPIATFSLTNPIEYKNWMIPCIELPCPKESSFYTEGWEHCEVVIGNASMDAVDNREFLEHFVSAHSHLSFDMRSVGKEINADVSLNINGDFSVKFHSRPLYEVCLFEKSHGLCIPVPEDYFKS